MSSQLSYKHQPIRTLGALSRALRFDEALLLKMAQEASNHYRLAKPKVKADGSIRQPFDAEGVLKEIHRRIKSEILDHVTFPYFLTGSLKGRDAKRNAELHAGSRIIICEDIQNFFPTTSASVVMDIWQNCLGFSQEVSSVLTALTTKEGALPQGAITSSFLANLAFWRHESALHDKLDTQGIQYSRYVDDIVVSSKRFLPTEEQTSLIAQIYGMLRKQGYSAKRRKHEVFTSGRRMVTTKLMTNVRPSLPSAERARVRAAVFQLERRVGGGERGPEVQAALTSVGGKVAALKRLHATEGVKLMQRITAIRATLRLTSLPVTATHARIEVHSPSEKPQVNLYADGGDPPF